MTNQLEPVPSTGPRPTTTREVAHRLRDVAASRAEEALAELPAIARRVRTLLLVLTISIPVLLIALVAILWHLAS
jgi:hypothetical protein